MSASFILILNIFSNSSVKASPGGASELVYSLTFITAPCPASRSRMYWPAHFVPYLRLTTFFLSVRENHFFGINKHERMTFTSHIVRVIHKTIVYANSYFDTEQNIKVLFLFFIDGERFPHGKLNDNTP